MKTEEILKRFSKTYARRCRCGKRYSYTNFQTYKSVISVDRLRHYTDCVLHFVDSHIAVTHGKTKPGTLRNSLPVEQDKTIISVSN